MQLALVHDVSETSETGVQLDFLIGVEDVFGVEELDHLVRELHLDRVFFEVFVGEDEVDLIGELDIVHTTWIPFAREARHKHGVVGVLQVHSARSEHDLLQTIQTARELDHRHVPFPQRVVVDEELLDPDLSLLHLLLQTGESTMFLILVMTWSRVGVGPDLVV